MKEDLIIEWFQSWFDSHWNNFEVIFEIQMLIIVNLGVLNTKESLK